MRVRRADEQNQQFVQWLKDLSYDPRLNDAIHPFPGIHTTSGLQNFFDGIYPPELLAAAPRNRSVFADRAILTARNATVADINHQIIRKLDGECKTYPASHTAEDLPQNHGVAAQVSPEVMFGVDVASFPASCLKLKVRASIILMTNLHP